VTGILAGGLGAPAGVITAWVIALLSLTAAVLVGVGLARAWLGRRRPQVVLHDVELEDRVPGEVAAGLSVQLREKVRRELRQHFDDASHAGMATVVEDLTAGLVTVRGGTVRMAAVAKLDRTARDSEAALSALDRTTSDSKAALSAGLRAVAPNEAEGLAVALDLALPAQRGWSVRSFPIIRGYEAKAQVGLSVEVAPLGRAPDAITTFWETSDALQRADSDAARLAVTRELLHELLRPASAWIAIQLVARHLEQIRDRPHGLPLARRSTREMTGLQLQLAGQMSLYATWEQRDSGAGFFEQGLNALDRAAQILPQYYRPPLTRAAIYERQGWSQRRSGEGTRAQNNFMLAIEALDEAEKLLRACGDHADTEKRDDAIERLAVRRTKCRLLSGDGAQADIALRELAGYTRLRDSRPVQLYNAACLFAVATACPHLSDEQRELSEWRAWHYLGHALVLGGERGAPWSKMTDDEELAALDAGRRVEFRTELQKRHDGHSSLTDDQAGLIVVGTLEVLGLRNPRP
jgi:tetratricopeptide (TPR) repeat protein